MRRALLASALLSACGGDPPAVSPDDASVSMDAAAVTDAASMDAPPDAPRYTGAAQVSVRAYDYAVDLTTRALQATLALRVTTPGDCITLSLQGDAPAEVRLGGELAREVSLTEGALRVCHPGAGFAPDAEVSLRLDTVVPNATWRPTQVGFSQRNNSAGRRFTYLLSWVGECGRIGPCDASPSRFATYRFAVTHPTGTEVLCPGTVTRGDGETVCEFALPGGPTYSAIGIMAQSGGWRRTELGAVDGVTLTAFDSATLRMAEALDRPNATGFLRWMSQRFGPYPYGDALRIVAAPTYWSGFEHPGNITLAETLVGNPGLDHTLRHEIAHQWAGDLTTLSTTKDFVWKEAMAEYLAFVYEDENISAERGLETLARWRDAAARAERYPVPDEDLPLLEYYGSAYGPGPMILFRQLEVMTSRRQVMEALRALLGRERALSVDDVRAALEASTGASLEGYFRAWLRGSGAPAWPAVDARYAPAAGGGVTVSATVQTRDGVARPCAFRLRLTGAGDRSLDVPMRVGLDGAAPQPVTVRPDFEVTGVTVDPGFEALVFPAMTATGQRWVERLPERGYDPFRAPDPPR
ncbi:MAG: M1 family aminopeptidase [Polyangiales bacterium]